MTVAVQPMTAAELAQLPRGAGRYELVRGELRAMSPAGHQHGRVAARVTTRMGSFVEGQLLGEVYAAETGFQIRTDPDTVRAPDVAFVRAERLQRETPTEEGYFPGPPDLAVEVVSPNDSYSDVEAKVAQWIGAGSLAVVVLDPRRQAATVYRPGAEVVFLGPGDVLRIPELLPGWSLPLVEVFR